MRPIIGYFCLKNEDRACVSGHFTFYLLFWEKGRIFAT